MQRRRCSCQWGLAHPNHGVSCSALQKRGLAVKEFELIRKNFSDTGNFGKRSRCVPMGGEARGHACGWCLRPCRHTQLEHSP